MNPPPRTSKLITQLRRLIRSAHPKITAESFQADLNAHYLTEENRISRGTVEKLVYGGGKPTPKGKVSSETILALQAWCQAREAGSPKGLRGRAGKKNAKELT